MVAVNAAMLAFIGLQLGPQQQTARLTGLLVAIAVLGVWAGRWLWQRPWRGPLLQVMLVAGVLSALAALGLRGRLPDRDERMAVSLVLSLGVLLVLLALWFLVVWRAQQIEARLREQAERAHAVEMAQRLAVAQLEPHFLFNTLASLQHWVHTGDARAGPMLDALVGYLRATLPMFHRALQPLADELEAVRRYLEVMAARFGPRLQWALDVPAALQQQPLPPGLLLTLVENAVEHGVQPSLSGAEVHVQATAAGGRVRLTVRDTGPGLDPAATDGVGLANSRSRLAQAFGDRATLRLDNAPDGGCMATLDMPLEESSPS
jgi:LytS/YehU family sensor histidine kinase